MGGEGGSALYFQFTTAARQDVHQKYLYSSAGRRED